MVAVLALRGRDVTCGEDEGVKARGEAEKIKEENMNLGPTSLAYN